MENRVDLALYGLHDSLDDEHSFQAMWYHPYCVRGTKVDFSHLFLPSWRGKCCLEEPIRPTCLALSSVHPIAVCEARYVSSSNNLFRIDDKNLWNTSQRIFRLFSRSLSLRDSVSFLCPIENTEAVVVKRLNFVFVDTSLFIIDVLRDKYFLAIHTLDLVRDYFVLG